MTPDRQNGKLGRGDQKFIDFMAPPFSRASYAYVSDRSMSDEKMHEMITSLLAEYRRLIIEESKPWND